MRINLIKLFVVSFLLFGCHPSQQEDESVPTTILNEDQMVALLTDAYLAEGASGINIKNVSGDKFDSIYCFNPVKDKKVSKALFDSSMTYYSSHPKKLKKIHDRILDALSAINVSGKVN
jgi:hypothetical protein